MSGPLTDVTEIVTALGTLAPDLDAALAARPGELVNVSDTVWARLVAIHQAGEHAASFATAFANGASFLIAQDGLRSRRPRVVEWKGPHRPPGDDVIPADLRIDHVYLVSCKYLSKVLLNAGPSRLFDRLLVGEERTSIHWFNAVAPAEFQAFYAAAKTASGLTGLPTTALALSSSQQGLLKSAFSARVLPAGLQPSWAGLCHAVAKESAERWRRALSSPRAKLRLLWRLLRIGGASYFVLGTDKSAYLRLRVASAWDWVQAFELRTLTVGPRVAGQPEVEWTVVIRRRRDGQQQEVNGHVEIRWSHGRFVGSPEAKVYLDTQHTDVPGYYLLS
jgi:hypothetical protein